MRPDVESDVRHTNIIRAFCDEGLYDEPGISVESERARIHKRGETITLLLHIDNEEVIGLMDTGANCSLISERYYEKQLRNNGVKLHTGGECIYDIGGNEIKVRGYITVDVVVQGIIVKNCVFYVKKEEDWSSGLCCSTKEECLVGMNVLTILFKEWGLTKLFERNKIPNMGQESKEEKLECCMRRVAQNLRIWNEDDLGYALSVHKQNRIIPRCSRKIIKIFVEKLKYVPKENILLEDIKLNSVSGLQPGVQVLASFTTCVWGIGHVCIANWNDEDIVIEAGCKVATASLAIVEVKKECVESNNVVTADEMRNFRQELGIQVDEENLSDGHLRKLEKLIYEFKDCFELSEDDLGTAKGWEHEINLTDDTPIKLPYRRIAPALIPEAKQLLQNLKQTGVIEESVSPYAAPVVLVRKKGGGLRLTIDYRKLNKVTVKDAFPLPRIAESLDVLEGGKYFSTFDLAQGYHQILLKEEDRPKTAFSVPWGHYQFRRCPMGLSNSPATFQRCMENILGEFVFEFLVVYLDDLIVFTKSIEEHFKRLRTLMSRIRAFGLKLKPKKCNFLKTWVKYLGFLIS